MTRLELLGVDVGVAFDIERVSARRFVVVFFRGSFILRLVATRMTPMSSLRSVTFEAESSMSSLSFSKGESVGSWVDKLLVTSTDEGGGIADDNDYELECFGTIK